MSSNSTGLPEPIRITYAGQKQAAVTFRPAS